MFRKALVCAVLALALGMIAAAEGAVLTVQGMGAVSLDPDIVIIQLGVRESSTDVSQAQAAVSEKLTRVVEKLREMGVQEEDIHTSAISIYEDFDYDSSFDSNGKKAYAAENNISVTIREIESAGKFIDAAFENGANTFSDIRFSASDTEEAQRRAMELSVANAREKAEVLAAAAGMRITGINAIREQEDSFFGANMDGGIGVAMEKAAGAVATPIYTEQLQVTATVNVEFAMTPAE